MKRNWRQALLLVLALTLTILLLLEVAPTDGTPTIVAALIAAAVALTINETVSERREREEESRSEARRQEADQRDRAALAEAREREVESQRRQQEIEIRLREQRERAYNEVLSHLLASFTGGSSHSEFYIRTKISMWGSAEFMEAYLLWRTAIKGLAGRGLVKVPTSSKAEIEHALSTIALVARTDLHIETSETLTSDHLKDVLFDDPEPTPIIGSNSDGAT